LKRGHNEKSIAILHVSSYNGEYDRFVNSNLIRRRGKSNKIGEVKADTMEMKPQVSNMTM